MEQHDENYMSMCSATDDYCTENTGVLTAVPALVAAHNKLKDYISGVKGYQSIADNDTTGWAKSKGKVKGGMIDKTLKLVNGIGAYALAKENDVLYNEIHISRTELEKMPDENVDVKCKLINSKGTEVGIAEFAEYGLKDSDFTLQEEAVTTYTGIKQKPSGKTDEKQVARENIKNTISKIRKNFELMDKLVKTMAETQPDFVNNYFKAREIYDLGVRHEKPETPPA